MRLSASCPFCPKTVAVKVNTEKMIVHDTPEGVQCEGSGLTPPAPEIAPRTPKEPKKPKAKEAKKRVVVNASALHPGGGSVWAVSGGLPGLGKRR